LKTINVPWYARRDLLGTLKKALEDAENIRILAETTC